MRRESVMAGCLVSGHHGCGTQWLPFRGGRLLPAATTDAGLNSYRSVVACCWPGATTVRGLTATYLLWHIWQVPLLSIRSNLLLVDAAPPGSPDAVASALMLAFEPCET